MSVIDESIILLQFSEKHVSKLDYKLNAFDSVTAIKMLMLERRFMIYDCDMKKFQYLSDTWNDICI